MDSALRETLQRYRMAANLQSRRKKACTRPAAPMGSSIFYNTLLDAQCATQHAVLQKYKELPAFSADNCKHKQPPKPTSFVGSSPVSTAPATPSLETYSEEIVQSLKENRVALIRGATGVGKTTQIPKLLLSRLSPPGLIGCTQPRRIAAVSVTHRMKEEVGDKDVGYKVRFEDTHGSKVKYMTEGILLREIHTDREIKRFSVIILDEVHEKSTESLILLRYISSLVRRRHDLYLVVMSASLEEDIAQEVGLYPIIEIPHRRHPVSMHYLKQNPEDYISAAVSKTEELAKHAQGNILVFLTGVEDIAVCHSLLAQKIRRMRVFSLHAKLPLAQQQEVVRFPHLKCILATNIAETSVTIPDVHYIVDCGMYKEVVYHPETNTQAMVTVPIQKPMAEQRAGRTGRTSPGECYRMYTEETYRSLKYATVGRIDTENLEKFVLSSLELKVPFPSTSRVEQTLRRLSKQKILSGCAVTPLGREVAQLPLSVVHSLFLIEGHRRGCGWECAVVIAMTEVCADRYRHVLQQICTNQTEPAHTQHSDHLALFDTYIQLATSTNPGGSEIGVHADRIDKIVEQLCRMLQIQKKRPGALTQLETKQAHTSILDALFVSHAHSRCRRVGERYQDPETGMSPEISRHSLLHASSASYTHVVYNEITTTTRPVMHILTGYTRQKRTPE